MTLTNWVEQISVHVDSSGRYVSHLHLVTLQSLRPHDLARAGDGQRLSRVARLQMLRSLLGKEHILVQIVHHLLAHGLQALEDVIVVRIGPKLFLIHFIINAFSFINEHFILVNILFLISSFDVRLRLVERDQVLRVDVELLAHYDGTATIYLVQKLPHVFVDATVILIQRQITAQLLSFYYFRNVGVRLVKLSLLRLDYN